MSVIRTANGTGYRLFGLALPGPTTWAGAKVAARAQLAELEDEWDGVYVTFTQPDGKAGAIQHFRS